MAEPSTHFGERSADGWQVVDGVLEELDRLAVKELSDHQFYAELAQRLTAIGCSASAVWMLSSSGNLTLEWRSPGLESGNGEVTSKSQMKTVMDAIESGEPRLADVKLPEGSAHDLADGPSIVAPWSADGAARGALQVWLAPTARPAATGGYLQFLAAVADLIATFQVRQQQRRLGRRLERQAQIESFTQSLHESLDVNDVAYRIASDARVLIGCDRVAVAVRRSGRYKVIAVSGAEHIHRRSEAAGQLAGLCDAVAATNQPFWQESQTQELPPQLSEPLAEYLDVSPALGLAVIPLTAPQAENTKNDGAGAESAAHRADAVLVFEQYAQPFDPAARDVISSLLGHCRLALNNALKVQAIPGHKFWIAIGREGWLSRWTTRAAIALGALAAVALILLAIPADVRIKARGELQPAVRHDVFAPRDGVVTSVFVDHGQQVEAEEKLLEMRSPELDLELQRVQGELETTRKRLAATQSERLQIRPGEADSRLKERRLTAEEEQLQQQVDGLESRQAMLREQLQQLTVRSPIAGDVITWNAQQRLAARPLKRGDALLTVADVEGPWQLEIRVPSRRAGRLLAAQRKENEDRPVSFVLATDPGVTLQGKIKRIAERVEIDKSGESYLLVTVEIPRDQIPHRVPGTTVVARISCGRSSLADAWFHELWDAFWLWMPF